MAFDDAFGDDSIWIALRLRDMTREASKEAFARLKRDIAEVNAGISLGGEEGGVGSGELRSLRQRNAVSKLYLDQMKAERELGDAILTSRNLGMDVSRQEEILGRSLTELESMKLSTAQALGKERVLGLQLAREELREQSLLQRVEANSAKIAKEETAAQGITAIQRQQLRNTLLAEERSLTSQIGVAKAQKLSTDKAEAILAQEFKLTQDLTLKDAQQLVLTRKLALETARKELALETARRGAGLGNYADPFGKRLGRGFPINDINDLGRSFTTVQGLSARTLSLFAGQVGTLLVYGAAFGGVAATVRTLIGGQSDLQQSTARLGIVMEGTFDEIERDQREAQDAARQWSRAHGQAVSDVVGAQYDLLAAGLSTQQMLRAFPAVALLSQGGLVSLSQASKDISVNFQAFSREALQPIEIANIMQATAAETEAQIEDLGVALQYVGGTAASANLSFAETNALIGTLGTLGLRGSKAGTSLNQFLTQLLRKRAEIKKLGVDVADATGALRPITDILADFRREFGTNISAAESSLLKQIFDVRGARAAERLIPDLVVLPRTLNKIQESQAEIFRAADEGADTLKESWGVFKNEVIDFLLGDLGTARGLQTIFDSLTNRKADRALQNMTVSASGLTYELGKLQNLWSRNEQAAVTAILNIYRAAEGKDDELSTRLREFGPLESFDTVFGESLPDKQARFKEAAAGMLDVMRSFVGEMEAEEDRLRGKRVIEVTLGFTPVTEINEQGARDLVKAGLEAQLSYLEDQIRAVQGDAGALGPVFTLVGPIAPETMEQLEDLLAAYAKLRGDRDKAVDVEAADQATKLAAARVALAKSEIEVLDSASSTSYNERKLGARQRLQLTISQLEQEKQLELDKLEEEKDETLKNVEAINERKLVVSREYNNKIKAEKRKTERTLTEIELSELEARYGHARRIRELEFDAKLSSLDAEDALLARRQQIEDQYNREREQNLGKYMLGGLDLQEYLNADRELLLERDRDLRKVTDDDRRRQIGLMELGKDATLAEAQQLIFRARAREKFGAKRVALAEEERMQEAIINAQHFDDDAERQARLDVLHREYQTKRMENYADEAEFLRDVMLDSISAVGYGLSGMAEFVSAAWGDSRAKILSDLSAVADASVAAIETVQRMRDGALSTVGGVFSLAGLGLGLLAQIIGSRRNEEVRDVRQLVDEYRHLEGRNASAEFGKAQVNLVRVEINPNIRFLSAPNQQEQDVLVRTIGDEMVDFFEQRGFSRG